MVWPSLASKLRTQESVRGRCVLPSAQPVEQRQLAIDLLTRLVIKYRLC